ncbi:unannotated protein [freshwater metagenome]|uniref:Unannotated protein n=1 Tax=freshwater metagenome TaxID=449393 RepID=A0A6J7JP36_9ZZZZ
MHVPVGDAEVLEPSVGRELLAAIHVDQRFVAPALAGGEDIGPQRLGTVVDAEGDLLVGARVGAQARAHRRAAAGECELLEHEYGSTSLRGRDGGAEPRLPGAQHENVWRFAGAQACALRPRVGPRHSPSEFL